MPLERIPEMTKWIKMKFELIVRVIRAITLNKLN
jgi:hypothetical protein